MSSKFQSKSYKQTSVNNKIVDRSGYDVAYDGKNAVIDALKNDELYRVEMDRDEFLNLMKQFYKSNRSRSQSIRDTLIKDFDIDKTELVGDLFRDKEYTRSLMSPMFSDDYQSDVDIGSKTRKRRRLKKKSRNTVKKRRKHKK